MVKAYGVDRFDVGFDNGRHGVQLALRMTIGSEDSMISLAHYKDKWFTVESVEDGADCWNHRVDGLKVVDCKGNIKVGHFFG